MTELLILASALVLGEIGAGRETLAGELYRGTELMATIDGSSTTCSGRLSPSIDGMGHGSLVCSDARTGHFSYRLDERGKGTGYGRLGKDSLVLTFD